MISEIKNKKIIKDSNLEDLIIKRIESLCKKENRIKNKKVTPYRIAINGEMNPRTLNNILNKTIKDPRISTIYRICIGLNISLKEFFSDDDLFNNKN